MTTETVAHTPGPWMVKHAGNQAEIWADRGLVAELSLYPQGSRAVAANARLMAAAPDLLEALRTIAYEPIGQPEASHREVLDQCVIIARAAIAKAEGR